MICKKCGTQVLENIKFCPSCGNYLVDESSLEKVNENNINFVEQKFEENNIQQDASNNIYNNHPMNNYNVEQNVSSGYNNQQPINNGINNVPYAQYNNGINNVPYAQYNNGFNQQQNISPVYDTTEKIKKKNKTMTIIYSIISILVFVACFMYFYSTSSSKNKDSNSNSNGISSSNSSSNIESNSNSVSNSNSASNSNSNAVSNSNSNSNSTADNVINFKGYSIQIPSTYTVSSSTTTIQLIGTNGKDVAVINIDEGSYDNIKASPTALEEYVKNRQIVCNNIKTTYYNGVEFTTAEITSNGSKMILGYAKIDNDHVFEIIIANTSYTIDYTEFNTFANVVKTLKAV